MLDSKIIAVSSAVTPTLVIGSGPDSGGRVLHTSDGRDPGESFTNIPNLTEELSHPRSITRVKS